MMDNNDDLKKLWGAQESVAAPDISALLTQATRVKNKIRSKLIRGNILLVFTAVFTGWVWIHYQPQMLTTKVGIVMIIAAIAMIVISSTSSLQFLFRGNVGMDTAKYLEQMLELRHKQEFLQKTMITLYFILLSAGICLYMIEYTMRMNGRDGFIAYAITLSWIAFNWFYTRPRTARKQMASLNEVIGKLEEINKQLKG